MAARNPLAAGFARAIVATLVVCGSASAQDAVVDGRVTLDLPGVTLRGVGPVVVFLVPDGDVELPVQVPPPVRIRQRDARFSPSFRVIVQGQTIEMPNDDVIYHNVFSYSHPNDFDLGIYPVGESRSVAFQHAGVVKVYCSIHESMNATIFVAPNSFYDVVRPDGTFHMSGVPPGDYHLETWSEKLPASRQPIRIDAGGKVEPVVPLS